MKFFSIALTALAVSTAMTSAFARPDDPHSRGVRTHARYYSPPARYHDSHHYYQGENWHGHPLVYRNGGWGYLGGSGVFINIAL